MSLEDKIKRILQEAKKEDDEKDLPVDDKEDELKDDDTDADDDKSTDKDDDEKDDEKTDMSKEKAEVKESSVPGTDSLLGTKVAEKLKGAESETSGASKTSKMTKGYDKGTKPAKLEDGVKKDSADAKGTADTSKITKGYSDHSGMPKLKAEAIEALFNGETLTEEFKVKAEAIFEAAVEQVAEAKIQALEEEFQLQLDEAVEEAKGELVEQIDGYLDHLVEKWMQDNAVALDSGIKVEMVSSFMESMKSVFEEHYIDVPESKIDVVEEQAAAIEELQAELAEAKELAGKALVESQVLKCAAIIAEASEGLTAIEAEKLKSLAENVDFDTEEDFAIKVKSLKESYFRKGVKLESEITSQDNPAQIKESKSHSDVDAVLKALQHGSLKLIRSSN